MASLVFITTCVSAAGEFPFSTKPRTNNGDKWQIALYQGGPYTDYRETLLATVKGLMVLGWIETTEVSSVGDSGQTEPLWDWLANRINSHYVKFLPDGHYSAHWNSDRRKLLRSEILHRLKSRRDIDLIIAMGTWAGQDLVNDHHTIPTVVLSSSDPLTSGVIHSIRDSGYSHAYAHVDPMKYERQLSLFHRFIGFRKLGIAYEDTVVGRSIAAVQSVERVADQKDFEIVRCFTRDDNVGRKEAEDSVKRCFKTLADNQVDAIYVTTQNGVNENSLPLLVGIANRYRLPTFSQSGSHEVSQGILLSMSRPGFMPAGLYHAGTIAKIFNGAEPRKLEQVFEEPPSIAVNLKTAEIIQLYLHADLLAAADQIYRDIKGPD